MAKKPISAVPPLSGTFHTEVSFGEGEGGGESTFFGNKRYLDAFFREEDLFLSHPPAHASDIVYERLLRTKFVEALSGQVPTVERFDIQADVPHDIGSATENWTRTKYESDSSTSATEGQSIEENVAPEDAQEDFISQALTETQEQRIPRWISFSSASYHSFLHFLPQGQPPGFEYKGVSANDLEITKRGLERGNSVQLHSKAWLEASDKKHRYGKNLRYYYKHWESLGSPTHSFFDWLDSTGASAGNPLPSVPNCPRAVLDSDTVLYISDMAETAKYVLNLICCNDGRCRIFDNDNVPVSTGADGWIFVLRDGVVYGTEKVVSVSGSTKERFHHSSFFGGKAVAAAGILVTDDKGCLTHLYPHSGHYRPGEADMQRILFFLHDAGIDLQTFQVDTQQIMRCSRVKSFSVTQYETRKKKTKKIATLQLQTGLEVAYYLAHKARFITQGICSQIRANEVSGTVEEV